MKKIISFSLWGTDPKYNVGALRNAELAQVIFPEWICRYYIGKSTPTDTVEKLSQLNNCEVIKMDEDGEWNSMFWRFFPISEIDTEIMLSRDCDSRLSLREKICVDEFIKSDKLFHRIVDHPFHGGIMGGMWGVKKGILSNIKELINDWPKTNKWQTDQSFLNHIIQPIVENTSLVHDSIVLKNFPVSRENYHFVGEIFDHNDNRHEQYGVFFEAKFSGL